MEKRIYSLNLMTYVCYKTGIIPVIGIDEESKACYAIFPENNEILAVIIEFRKEDLTVPLHDYLNTYRTIKERMKEAYGNGTKW